MKNGAKIVFSLRNQLCLSFIQCSINTWLLNKVKNEDFIVSLKSLGYFRCVTCELTHCWATSPCNLILCSNQYGLQQNCSGSESFHFLDLTGALLENFHPQFRSPPAIQLLTLFAKRTLTLYINTEMSQSKEAPKEFNFSKRKISTANRANNKSGVKL